MSNELERYVKLMKLNELYGVGREKKLKFWVNLFALKPIDIMVI